MTTSGPLDAGVDALEAQLRAREARLLAFTDAWVHGPRDAASVAFSAAWALASIARLTLLEPGLGAGWWAALIVSALGGLGVFRFGGRLWWLLSLLGPVVTLVALRDWMTQSVIMAAIAAVGVATQHRRGDSAPLRRTAWALVATTYFIAVFQKLNTGFLDPDLSCATYGADKLSRLLGAGAMATWLPPGAPLRGALPPLVLATEAAIGGLLLWRPRWGVALGAAFHIPLTWVLAPAFAFVMGVGYAATLTPDACARTLSALRAPRRTPLWARASGLAAALAGAAVGLATSDVLIALKTALLTAVAALAVGPTGRGAFRRPNAPMPRLGAALLALFVANAATPYLGTQVQHTGAMLSNLRVDADCWNHVVVPESVRRVDPYLRIDHARIGVRGAHERREAVLRETLWSPSALVLIRRNWCRPHTRPIAIAGSGPFGAFALDDLCAPDAALPSGVGLFGGRERVRGFLKLQKNLPRRCDAACIH